MKKFVLAIISLLFYANVSHSALWIKIGLEDKTVSSVACNSQNGNIYAVADNLLYLSENDGLDWTLLNLDVNQPWVHVYRVLVDAKGRIYAGTNNGIYCSDNADHSFRAINTGLPHPPNVTAICCPDINSLAIGTNAGVFISDKDSIQWTAFNRNLPERTPNQLLCHRERFYLATNSGIYVSPTDSAHWEQCFFNVARDLAAQDAVIYAATHISGSDYDQLGALYQSSNSGSSWERLSPNEGNVGGHAVFCDENRIWLGTHGGGGLYSPDRGAYWETLNLGPWFTALTFAQRGSALLTGTEFYKHIDDSGGLYIQYNVFSSNRQEIPFPEFITCPGAYNNRLYVELSIPANSKVYYSLDGGTPDSSSLLYLEPIKVDSTTLIKVIAIYEDKTTSIVNPGLFKIGKETGLKAIPELDHAALPYPNPCSDFINLTVPDVNANISVINLTGQVVYSDQAVQSGNYRLPVHALKPGLYILQLRTAAGKKDWKFIRQP